MNIELVGGKNLIYTSLNNYSIHHYTNFMNLKLKLYFATLIAIYLCHFVVQKILFFHDVQIL